MKKVIVILSIVIILGIAGYVGWGYYKDAQEKQWQQTFELAENTLLPIKKAFKSTLMQGMQRGIPEAVNYCNLEAPSIAEATPEGVEVGRTSHKLRNPKNKPDELLQGPLNYFLEQEQQGQKAGAQLAQLPDDSWIYVEPIYTQATCLACHGPNIDPAVLSVINEKYPQDEATGFAEGEFRGMFWMKLENDFVEAANQERLQE